MFSNKREKGNINIVVELIRTRVIEPDEDDWKKIVCMIRHLRRMSKLPLTTHTYRTNIFKWWVDGSHGVNPNCKGHMGENQSQGKGPTIRK